MRAPGVPGTQLYSIHSRVTKVFGFPCFGMPESRVHLKKGPAQSADTLFEAYVASLDTMRSDLEVAFYVCYRSEGQH